MTRLTLLMMALLLAACGGTQTPAETTTETTTGNTAAPTIALPNQVGPEEGVLTGGQPTEQDLRAASELGYLTVITLRTPEEQGFEDERALAEELGMSFESIPISGADDATLENAAQLDALLSSATGPTIVHCASGNRVGALFALRAFAAGRSVEESLEIGRGAGLTRLEDAVRERLGALCEADPEHSC